MDGYEIAIYCLSVACGLQCLTLLILLRMILALKNDLLETNVNMKIYGQFLGGLIYGDYKAGVSECDKSQPPI